MSELEVRYRRLLAAYPADHRAAHDGEMLATLLDAAEPGRTRPTTREAAAIVTHGLAYRYRAAPEWRLGLRLAGVLSLALATVLAVAALGVAALPPIDNPVRTHDPSWLPVVAWLAALGTIPVCALLRRTSTRVVVPIVAAAVLVLGGPWLTGMPRMTYVSAFGMLLFLSSAAPRWSGRRQAAAAAAGVAVGLALVYRFVSLHGSPASDYGFRETGPMWTMVDRWNFASDVLRMRPGLWLAGMAIGLVVGLVRPRFAVAAGLLAAPVGLLTVRYSQVVGFQQMVLAVVFGTALLFAVAATRHRPPRPQSQPAEDAVSS